MKSLIVEDHSIHQKLKVLAAQLNKTIVQVTEEAILNIVEKYRIINEIQNNSE